jgi:hypothetical protein
VDERPEEARGLLAAGDVPGLLRYLRADGVLLPLGGGGGAGSPRYGASADTGRANAKHSSAGSAVSSR